MKKDWQPNYGWAVVAGLLAWVIPGAGHILLHRTVRGVIIFVCVVGLFWSGMAIGGVFTVDPIRERWWFIGQMCTGASGFIGYQREERAREAVAASAGISPLPHPGMTRTGDDWWTAFKKQAAQADLWLAYPGDGVARAYSGIAGMLNIMCVFDAVMLALLGKRGEEPPAEPEPQPSPTPKQPEGAKA